MKVDELKKTLKDSTELDTRKRLVIEALEQSAGATSPRVEQPDSDKERILVSKGAGKLIALCFDLPQVEIEIERAVAQVRRNMASEETSENEKRGSGVNDSEKKEL